MDRNLITQRLQRIQQKMQEKKVDYLILSPSPNLFFLTGIDTHSFERLYVLVIPATGTMQAVVPAMNEQEVAADIGDVAKVYGWKDGEDPLKYVAAAISGKTGTVAFDDNMTALHTLAVMSAFPGYRHVLASQVMADIRLLKDEYDAQKLTRAGEVVDALLTDVVKVIKPGMTENDVIRLIRLKAIEAGTDGLGFSPLVAAGPNSANPHHGGSDRRIEKGDALFIDFGVKYRGYHSDITRSYVLGQATEEMKKVYAVVRAAHEAGVKAGQPGVACEEVDMAARKVIIDAGYGAHILHRTGHGLGLEVHEDPYMVLGNKTPLAVGMVYSVEPGIYIAGKFGFRLEDIVIQTAAGAKRFNNLPRELVEL